METMKVSMVVEGVEMLGEVYFEDDKMIFTHGEHGRQLVFEGFEFTSVNTNYKDNPVIQQAMTFMYKGKKE